MWWWGDVWWGGNGLNRVNGCSVDGDYVNNIEDDNDDDYGYDHVGDYNDND